MGDIFLLKKFYFYLLLNNKDNYKSWNALQWIENI